MKVSFCTGWDIERDGIADYSKNLVNGLKRFVSVNVIGLGHYVSEREYYIRRAEEANQGDLAHVQFNYVYFNGSLPYRNRFLTFAKYLKVPVVMTVHELRAGYDPIPPGITSKIKRLLFNNTLTLWNLWSVMHHRKMFGYLEKIFVHTKGQAEVIKGLVDNKKVVVIPHGIPIVSSEKKAIPHLDAKRELALEGKTVLTIFGFINRGKGYEPVMDALLELPKDVVLLIAGGKMTDNAVDREYYDNLLKKIAVMGLDERVRITGYLNEKDIPAVMAATDICLAPFLSQSASGALSLCIGYNKPIIASDISVNIEVNERIPCLEIFKSGYTGDLLKRIISLIKNSHRRNELVKLTQDYSEGFNYTKMAEDTVKVYRDVIGEDGADRF